LSYEFTDDEEKSELEIAGTDVAMPCPKCSGKMVGVAFDSGFLNFKKKSINTCMECGSEVDIAKWEQELYSV